MRPINALLVLLMSTLITPSGQPADNQANDFKGAGAARVVTWQVKRVPPPSPLYVDVDDKIQVGAATSQSNEVVTINYRLLRAADGVIVRGQFTVAPASNRTLAVVSKPLAEGFLLSVSCKAAVATTRGQTFARIFLGAGAYGAGQPAYMLMADYVTTAMAPAFPNGRQLTPVEGPGVIVHYQITPPGAGNDWSAGPPTNARWRVLGVEATLTTDAVVQNRQVTLTASASGFRVWRAIASALQIANQLVEYDVSPGVTEHFNAALNIAAVPIPQDHLLSGNDGDGIGSLTPGMDVGDTWAPIVIAVEEWLENV